MIIIMKRLFQNITSLVLGNEKTCPFTPASLMTAIEKRFIG